jgi:hypothetical protein
MEGVIYSRLPFWYHLIGIPELFLQTLAFFWVAYAPVAGNLFWEHSRVDCGPVSHPAL